MSKLIIPVLSSDRLVLLNCNNVRLILKFQIKVTI